STGETDGITRDGLAALLPLFFRAVTRRADANGRELVARIGRLLGGERTAGKGRAVGGDVDWVVHSLGAAVVLRLDVRPDASFAEARRSARAEVGGEVPVQSSGAQGRVVGAGDWRLALRRSEEHWLLALVPTGQVEKVLEGVRHAEAAGDAEQLVARVRRAADARSAVGGGIVDIRARDWWLRATGVQEGPSGTATLPGFESNAAGEGAGPCAQDVRAVAAQLPEASVGLGTERAGTLVEIGMDTPLSWVDRLASAVQGIVKPGARNGSRPQATAALGVEVGEAVSVLRSTLDAYRTAPLRCERLAVLDRGLRRLNRAVRRVPPWVRRVSGGELVVRRATAREGSEGGFDSLAGTLILWSESPGTLLRALEVFVPGLAEEGPESFGEPSAVPGLAEDFRALSSAASGMTKHSVVLTVGSNAVARAKSSMGRAPPSEGRGLLLLTASDRFIRMIDGRWPLSGGRSRLHLAVEDGRIRATIWRDGE
ncbi:MAG: hypothetical protein ABEL76_02260, partial [Bradymonadaceae bacterium]